MVILVRSRVTLEHAGNYRAPQACQIDEVVQDEPFPAVDVDGGQFICTTYVSTEMVCILCWGQL